MMRTTEEYIKEKGRYFEAEAKVSMREGFNKAYVTHTSKGFDTEPTEAEAAGDDVGGALVLSVLL